MSKILMLGFSLPTGKDDEIIQASNIRAQQFIDALHKDGHEIVYLAKTQPNFISKQNWEQLREYIEIDLSKPGWRRKIIKLVNKFNPDCCVSSSFFTSFAATFFNWKLPVWIDIFGDPLAEKQALMYREGTNEGLYSITTMESRLFRTGDKFSTCSEPQKYAVIGKLGYSGRLNQYTFGYQFVHAILSGIISINKSNEKEPTQIIRNKFVKMSDFVLLWIGGYNTWADVESLFKGIESAMEKDPSVKFVSTGGPVVNEGPYNKFRQMISQSKHKERFIFLGWIPQAQLNQLCRECDLGISTDENCYETELGYRNRLLEMISHGLPVLTSEGPEIASIIAREGFGQLFKINDFKEISERILETTLRKKSGKGINKKELAHRANQKFKNTVLCRPLVNWCRNPAFAPDRNRISRFIKMKGILRSQLRDLKTRYLGGKYIEPDYKNGK